MNTFSEVDFYKAMLQYQKKATDEAFRLAPIETSDGKLAYPVGRDGYEKSIHNVEVLDEALKLLKMEELKTSPLG